MSIDLRAVCFLSGTFLSTPAWSAPSYEADIRPILDTKCVSCHACYDAPCQLNLTDPEGWKRGATTASVYGGLRLKEVPLTRLFEDAEGEDAWRDKGFFPVVGEDAGSSLLWSAVVHGASHTFSPDEPPVGVDLALNGPGTCPQLDAYPAYVAESPLAGMPYGMASLTPDELESIRAWLDAGAPVDTVPDEPTDPDRAMLDRWERYLNRSGAREQLVARYLYEHFYLAKVFFSDTSEHAYRLVRSSTAPGEPSKELPTRRPDEAPGTPTHFYRFELVRGTRVRKNHLPVVLDATQLERMDALFFADAWTTEPGTARDWEHGQNPFISFRDIPKDVRYRFLLEHAWFFISNFIRGPVCRGPIALNVIQDRFFVAFLDPEADLDAAFVDAQQELLELPDSTESLIAFTRGMRRRARQQRQFLRHKNHALQSTLPQGRAVADLWTGHPDAQLTVFRHRDSATVVRDWVGADPETVWVMDYTTLERTYYSLVANFDVFGPTFHQSGTRLYFDFIRSESEDNFLLFLPDEARKRERAAWYQGMLARRKQRRQYVFAGRKLPSAVDYQTADPKTELLARFARPDRPIPSTKLVAKVEGWLRTVERRPQPTARFLPEMTVVHVVVDGSVDNDLVYSISRDRAHRNVAFMLMEKARLQPELDGLTAVSGVLGDYPNRIFRIDAAEVDTFFEQLVTVAEPAEYVALVERFGIFRTDPALFDETDWLYQFDRLRRPQTAGRLDLYRYGGELPKVVPR
jgi:hypothetical protein